MPEDHTESGFTLWRESDLSVQLRGVANWALMTAAMAAAAWASVTKPAPFGSPWLALVVLGVLTYPLALLVFIRVPSWLDRLISALKTTGLGLMLAAVIVLNGVAFPDWVWAAVVGLSLAVAIGHWRANRAERAAEARALQDDQDP